MVFSNGSVYETPIDHVLIKKDSSELLAELRRAIQVLAVDNLSKGISLSSGLSELSKTLTEFQNESERNANLAIGLSSIAMFLR